MKMRQEFVDSFVQRFRVNKRNGVAIRRMREEFAVLPFSELSPRLFATPLQAQAEENVFSVIR